MVRARSFAKWIAVAVILLVVVQMGSPYLFRNRRMRAYLLAHLQKSFGRRVEAQGFSVNLLPLPEIEMDRVSIAEDPAFGQEYFLRADKLTAGVRWLGLARGHFDFGTISLTRPSLILVRNEQGRWNLEGWLPPATLAPATTGVVYGPRNDGEGVNHLQKIEFDEGRVNFKTGDEKRPFAFIGVSGSVEQVAPGRWQLRLEAQPWRSGVPLQSTGTLQVRGEVAGTSARLQPAEIQVHWEKVSLADLFRMTTGYDYGLRGDFALDGAASIGKPAPGEPVNPGVWKFAMHVRAARIHRWDLIERGDNPSLSANLKGAWDVPAGEARVETATLDLPHSRFDGTASLKTAGMSEWNLRVNDAGVQAQDLLAWYRAFQPDVAEAVSARQFFKAAFAVHGRPLVWDDAAVTSDGGELRLPGFAKPVHIGSVQGSTVKNKFQLLPVRLFLDGTAKEVVPAPKSGKTKPALESPELAQNEVEIRYAQDFSTTSRTLSVGGRLSDVANLFKASAALGKTLNAGWELTGGATGSIERAWTASGKKTHWTGAATLAKAQLQAAALNLPLQLDDVRIAWTEHGRNAAIARADAFGATWSGTIEEHSAPEDSLALRWSFQLHGDHLDAKNLDLWFGPRARPNWLQRLLPSLLGKSDSAAKPSDLLRRVSAEGELTVDSLTIEKVKLAHPRAHIAFRDLHLYVTDADSEWAGGVVRGNVTAVFSVPPQYEISAEVDRANLSQFPWGAHWADRWNGAASGKIHLTTSGVGRDALLGQLTGSGEIHLKSIELRGWDVPASLDGGAVRTGSSRWASADGDFTVKDRAVQFEALQLENLREKTQVSGSFGFTQDLNLAFARETTADHQGRTNPLSREFLFVGPMEAPVVSLQAVGASQAKKQE